MICRFDSPSTIKNYIAEWERRYIVKAPFDGLVNYTKLICAEQAVSLGEEVVAVIPQNQQYIAYATLPTRAYGKLKKGQKARIKLREYPYQEYGYLTATVTHISLVPTKSLHLVTLSVDRGCVTTYSRKLTSLSEMSGIVEIVTDKTRLLSKIVQFFLRIVPDNEGT